MFICLALSFREGRCLSTPSIKRQAREGRRGRLPPLASSAHKLCFCFFKSLPLSPSLFDLVTDSRCGLGSLLNSSAISPYWCLIALCGLPGTPKEMKGRNQQGAGRAECL